jgi:signal transduction histidine kinase
LRQMWNDHGVSPISVQAQPFDPPAAGLGALFPISRGMLQAANIQEDLAAGEVVAADGRSDFVEAIKEFEAGDLDARLLEVLCCSGCIMGAGMSCTSPLFNRRSCVSHYVRNRLKTFDKSHWRKQMDAFGGLNFARTYRANDLRLALPSEETIDGVMRRMGKDRPADELNCGACGYETCREHAIAICKGLAESEMCLPYAIERLRDTVQELASAREALTQTEKLATMGQLAAGIAHEVNNPLGVVIMFAHLLLDELGEDDARRSDIQTIVENADRCKKIVSGLLHFARQNKVALERTDIRRLVDRCVRTMVLHQTITLHVEHPSEEQWAEVDCDQITQVLTNLISNAQAAMPDGGELKVATEGDESSVALIVSDTGVGIPSEHRARIFDPFFTTKQVGKGTGLGLAVTYGIVKMHRGQIEVTSNNDPSAGATGTSFRIVLPRRRS